jgi:perosamine synthetase
MGMIKIPKKSEVFFEKNYKKIFETGALAEGEWNKKIKEWAVNYTGSKYSEVFNSNGAGIFSILSVLKEYRGKTDYFIQSNTMYGVKTMGAASGLEFVGSVSCVLDTLMPSIASVRGFLLTLPNPESTVFLLTHIGGWVNPDIKEIVEACEKVGVVVVEDCAHSLGATLNGEHTGLFGIAGVYSLYATKAIPVGEGGIMVTNDSELSDLVSRFIIYDRFQQKMSVGINLRMSEMNALLAYGVLIETGEIIKSKQAIARRYMEACDSKNIDYIDPFSNGQKSNLYKFILVNKANTAESLFAHITSKTSPVYEYMLGEDPENIAERHICLPIWYDLDENIILDTIKQILDY